MARTPIKVDYPNWTAVPNALFEILPELSEAELKVALVIIRETLGWHKRETTISLAEIASIAGLSKGSCCDAAKELSIRGLIKKEANKGSEGECAATTYRINFSGTIPPFAQPNTPPPPVRPAEHPPFAQPNGIRNKEINLDKKEEYSSPTPSLSELNLEDPVEEFIPNASRRGGGPKIKLTRKIDARMVEKLSSAEQSNGVRQFRQAWINFLGWLKAHREIEEPLSYFLAAPNRWIFDTPTVVVESEPVDLPSIVLTPQTTARDFPAEWNAVVTSAPVDWDAKRSPGPGLRKAAADPVFCQRFEEICKIAQKCHDARGTEASWITFEWLLRDKGEGFGWWRLLTGLRWMSEAPVQAKKSNVFDEVEKLMQKEREKKRA